jgi:hypothetical protein
MKVNKKGTKRNIKMYTIWDLCLLLEGIKMTNKEKIVLWQFFTKEFVWLKKQVEDSLQFVIIAIAQEISFIFVLIWYIIKIKKDKTDELKKEKLWLWNIKV